MRKEIAVNGKALSCEVCGRTVLKGESTETYLTAAGERREVCDLCRVRVEHQGWIRESVRGDMPARKLRRRSQRRSIRDILSRSREEEAAGEVAGDELVATANEGSLEVSFEAAEDTVVESTDEAEAQPQEQPSDIEREEERPSAIKDPRHVKAVPTNAEVKVERALEIFNTSEHPRTIAGIARTLGSPSVSAFVSEETPSQVTLTVAWELSWYRYSIELGDADEQVTLHSKGHELEELPDHLRQWNALMDDHGMVKVAASPSG